MVGTADFIVTVFMVGIATKRKVVVAWTKRIHIAIRRDPCAVVGSQISRDGILKVPIAIVSQSDNIAIGIAE